MGLLKRLLGGGSAGARSGGDASQFHETATTTHKTASVNAPRRELVQVVLRDTMRKHGIPSDWIDCRILSVVTRRHKTGMHVQFIVRQGEERMLQYVHPFQETFWRELEKFEARPREWLFSLAWQFDGDSAGDTSMMVGSEGWDTDTQPPDTALPHDTQPPEQEEDELATDLQALYAIRDAAMSQPGDMVDLPPAKPGSGRGPSRP